MRLMIERSLSAHFCFENVWERVGGELVAVTLVELVLELDPVKTEGVQEALHRVHAHQHAEGDRKEHEERDEQL